MKRPRQIEVIIMAIQDAELAAGHREFTSHHAARIWRVAPSTARRWLKLWEAMGMVTSGQVRHRPNVLKRIYRPDTETIGRLWNIEFGTVSQRSLKLIYRNPQGDPLSVDMHETVYPRLLDDVPF